MEFVCFKTVIAIHETGAESNSRLRHAVAVAVDTP